MTQHYAERSSARARQAADTEPDERPCEWERVAEPCRQRFAGCTGTAETVYMGDWPVCFRCLSRLSQ